MILLNKLKKLFLLPRINCKPKMRCFKDLVFWMFWYIVSFNVLKLLISLSTKCEDSSSWSYSLLERRYLPNILSDCLQIWIWYWWPDEDGWYWISASSDICKPIAYVKTVFMHFLQIKFFFINNIFVLRTYIK